MQYGTGERGKLPKETITTTQYTPTLTEVVLAILVSAITIALVVALGVLFVLPLI